MDAEEAAAAATLTDLPTVVQQEVLRLAGLEGCAAAAVTCRGLRAAAEHPPLWEGFYAQRMRPLRGVHDDGFDTSTPRGGWQSLFRRWASGSPARTLLCPSGSACRGVSALAFVGDALCSSFEDGSVVEWDAATGAETRRLPAAQGAGGVNALVACGGTVVATGGVDNAVRVADLRARGGELVLQGAHAGEVLSLASLRGDEPGGAAPLLASGGGDEQVRVWDTRFAAEALLELSGCSGSVFSLAHDAEARRLYAGARRDVCLFSLLDGEWLTTLTGHSHDVYGLVLAGTRLLSCGEDGRVCEWHRLPPLTEAEEAVQEEQEPCCERTIRTMQGDATSVTCLAGLGRGLTACLAGTWEGDVVLAHCGAACRTRNFGLALPRSDGAQDQRADAVTALAARDHVVAVGLNSGALRLMLMDDDDEDQRC